MKIFHPNTGVPIERDARGLTNREIAGELFLSTKTVEMHLGSSYRKLGIGGRTELAAAFGAADGADSAIPDR